MNEGEYRTIAHGGLLAAGCGAVAVLVLGIDLLTTEGLPGGPAAVWTARGVGLLAGAAAAALLGIEWTVGRRGPRFVYLADPATGRVIRHTRCGPQTTHGTHGFHCVIRLRGLRRRAEVFHDGVRTGMSLSVVRVDPEAGEVLALWRDGHAIESTVYVRVDDLLTALAALSDAEVELLLSTRRSEPMAGLLFALIGRRMAQYRSERDRAEWELGVSQAALGAAEEQVHELTAELEAARRQAQGPVRKSEPGVIPTAQTADFDEIRIDEERLRQRAKEPGPKDPVGSRVARAVGRVIDAAAHVAGAAGSVAGRVTGRGMSRPPEADR